MPVATVQLVNPDKLQPPRTSHGLVAHDRLLGLRPDPTEVPVVELVAAAGYGKTTVLAEWVDHDARPLMWVTLDQYDDDPTVLVTHIAQAALDAGAPASGLRDAMSTPSAEVWAQQMPRLAVALRGLGSYTLALDDVHTVTSPRGRDVIEWLALHVAAGSQVLVGGRSSCFEHSSRLSVQGKLARLGAADLALTDQEAHELLLERGLEVTPTVSADLNRWCEGWTSGLLMASMTALADGRTPTSMIQVAQTQLVAEYLSAEVLANLPSAEREFLQRISVLDVASGPLCDALLERTGSQALLDRLCVANAFVAKLADGSCRLHELLRAALLTSFEEEDPLLVAELRSRAATWYGEHGNVEEAVRYSQESGLVEQTVGLISSSAVAAFSLGRHTTLRAWFEWVESATVVTDPLMVTAAAMLSALSGEPERSERWAASLHQAPGGQAALDGDPVAESCRAIVDAWQCRRGAEGMLADATLASELTPAESPWWGSAIGALAVAHLMNGQEAQAIELLMRLAEEDGPGSPDTNSRSIAAVFLARAAIADHKLAEARAWLEISAEFRRAGHTTEQGLQAFEDAVGARLVLLLDADVDRARQMLVHAQSLRSLTTWAIPGLTMPIRVEMIKAHLALGDDAAARVLVREIRTILQHRPGLGVFEAEASELGNTISHMAEAAFGPTALTIAELRLMPWLPTHLSFREIGERLFLSTNTVKTQALSAYRKLGVSSRSDAVEAAVAAGLLDPASLPGILHAG